ncbi:MAG: hypothetical protein ABIP48_22220, partial [Planctomycetota bacterium]
MSFKRVFQRFSRNWGNRQHRPSRKSGGREPAPCRARNLRIEQFEQRALLAIGPELGVVFPNTGGTLDAGEVLDVAPRELLFRFTEGQTIDAGTLGGIEIERSGGDGTFTDANEVLVQYGWIGLADKPNEVIARFAETLPDDLYHINIIGSGATPLQNTDGDPFNDGVDVTIEFELDLGAQVISVVPQPVSRDVTQALLQAKNSIVVYFNEDLDPVSVETPEFYQLIVTNDTATTADDTFVDLDPTDPNAIVYDSATHKVTLTYPNDLATYGTGAFRLRIGTEYQADLPGVLVTPVSGLRTTESGGAAQFAVTLTSQPTADVTIGLSSSVPGEGTAAPASLTFNSANWNVSQMVTVTGADDFVDDGDVGYTIVTAAA